ncbi:hypothetical protein [Maricaulis parjimensis]|uniref:hypothetical protein n=1 Tax=Maricaulis parjimensis TaxID=144023 RepID=UPI001939B23E|nr:hypothetical protein [Maricaulis parjimensis]
MATASAQAQTSVDSQAWLTAPASPDASGSIRWRLSTETSTPAPVILSESHLQDREVSAIASQFDFYPFGEEFYLSAGTVSRNDRVQFPGSQINESQPAWAAFPHAELAEDLDRNSLETLTRYFGAGVTVRTIDDWSLTVEGGAYFQDTSQDQMVLFDPETGERMRLLEDLDRMDADAVGETQSRTVRPVGHLVLRRRF